MAETSINVNVTGTNDLAALTAKLEAFKAKTTLTTNALIQQRIAATNTKAIFRDYGVAVKNSSDQVMHYKDVVQSTYAVQNQFGLVADKTTRNIKRFGAVGLQQVGYQVGDFAVQVQGGTSALVALGQQGAQLLGIFGPGGAVAGAVLAIGTAIANVYAQVDKVKNETDMTRPSEEFGKFKGAVDKVSTSIERLKLITSQDFLSGIVTEKSVSLLKEEVAARQALLRFEKIRFEVSIDNTRREIEVRQKEIDQLLDYARQRRDTALAGARSDAERERITQNYNEKLQEAIESNRELFLTQGEQRAELKLAEVLLAKMNEATDEQVETAEEVVEAFNDVKVAISEAGGAFDTIDPIGFAADVESSAVAFKSWVEELRQVKDLIGEANYEALRLAGVDMSPGIRAAAAEALSLAERLKIAFMEAFRIVTLANAESSVGLDAFGGAGDFQYSYPQTISAPKEKTGGGGGGSKEETQTLEEYVAALEQRLLKERELIGLSEEVRAIEEYRIDLVEDLRDKYPEMGTAAIEAAAAEIAAIKQVNEEMEKKQAKWDEFSEFVGNEFGSALSSIIDGSKTVGEAFGDMVTSILNEILRLLIIEPLVNSITNALKGIGGGGGFLGGLFGSANGNAFGSSGVIPFANGGVVNGPTIFPFANGVGLMGEAGPEAIMPLKRTPSGKLGVIAQGSGGQTPVNVVVNNYSNENADVQQNSNGDMVVTIGRALAKDISNGGASYKAMQKAFGLNNTVRRRG